jgi:hypothetical protein
MTRNSIGFDSISHERPRVRKITWSHENPPETDNVVIVLCSSYHWLIMGHSRFECSGQHKWIKEWRSQEVSYCLLHIMIYAPCIVRILGKSRGSLLFISQCGIWALHREIDDNVNMYTFCLPFIASNRLVSWTIFPKM